MGPQVRFSLLVAVAGLLACNRPIDTKGVDDPSPCAEQGVKACTASCDSGDADACLMAAIGTNNETKKTEFNKRACEGGHALGCRFYAFSFIPKSEDSDTPPDHTKAREFFGRGCDKGDAASCVFVAIYGLSPAVDGDERTMRDPAAARAAWEKACALKPQLCAGLADMEKLGLGGAKDSLSANRHYTTACEAGNDSACYNLKTEHPEVLLHGQNLAMFELLSSPDPQLAFEGAMPGQRFDVDVATCFEAGSVNAMRAYVLSPSESPAVDQAVLETVQQWKARARAPFPEGVAGCIRARFLLQMDQHIRAKFGS